MRTIANKKSRQGFTLIELVCCIVLLGIVAVMAVPRIRNFSAEARRAHARATAASVKATVNSIHLKWLMDPRVTSVNLNGRTVAVNSYGYPGAQYWDVPVWGPDLSRLTDFYSPALPCCVNRNPRRVVISPPFGPFGTTVVSCVVPGGMRRTH